MIASRSVVLWMKLDSRKLDQRRPLKGTRSGGKPFTRTLKRSRVAVRHNGPLPAEKLSVYFICLRYWIYSSLAYVLVRLIDFMVSESLHIAYTGCSGQRQGMYLSSQGLIWMN